MAPKNTQKESQKSDAREGAPSRRRPALYRRATELAALRALESALVVLSPGTEPVTTDFPPTRILLSQTVHEAKMEVLNMQYQDLLKKLEAAKKLGEELKQNKKEKEQLHGRRWWDIPVDELNLEELQKQYATMADYHERATNALMKRLAQTNAQTEGCSAGPNGQGAAPGN